MRDVTGDEVAPNSRGGRRCPAGSAAAMREYGSPNCLRRFATDGATRASTRRCDRSRWIGPPHAPTRRRPLGFSGRRRRARRGPLGRGHPRDIRGGRPRRDIRAVVGRRLPARRERDHLRLPLQRRRHPSAVHVRDRCGRVVRPRGTSCQPLRTASPSARGIHRRGMGRSPNSDHSTPRAPPRILSVTSPSGGSGRASWVNSVSDS